MARYKPKTTTAKLVASKTEIAKSATVEGRWVIAMATVPGKVLPGISVDKGAVIEHPDFKLRREATAALDGLLEAVDTLDPATTAQIPLEDSIRLGLEWLADVELVAASES